MKLKKILALVLAGVMAVSMLAGCKDEDKPEGPTGELAGESTGGSGGESADDSDDDPTDNPDDDPADNPDDDPTDDPTDETEKLVVSVLSDGTKDNTVKINFTYDTELEKALSQALEKNGKVGTTYLKNLLGIDGVALSGMYGYESSDEEKTPKAGTQTTLLAYSDKSAIYDGTGTMGVNMSGSTDEAFMQAVAKKLNETKNMLVKLMNEREVNGVKYTFSYTGKTAMVTYVGSDGVAVRYVGVIITCTTADSSDAPSV